METYNLKILLIDDNRFLLMSMRSILENVLPGCTLFTARNGFDGIKSARNDDPDVILLDIVMPDMDGYEVCYRLKADEYLRDIPVVFITALNTDKQIRMNAISAGAEGFLSKPIDQIELVAQIRSMAKIKAANRLHRTEKDRLEHMVAKRTCELVHQLAEREQNDLVTDVRLRLMQQAAVCSVDDLYQSILGEIAVLTGSGISFYYMVDPCQNAIEIQAWYCNSTEHQCQFDGMGSKVPIDRADFWEECIREGKAVIHNDCSGFFYRDGFPPNHTLIVRELVCPVSRDGVIVALVGVGSKLSDYDANDICMVSSLLDHAWDIVERKRAVDSLRQNEESHKSILHTAMDGFCLLNMQGQILEVNSAYCQLSGYCEQELLAMCITDLDAIERDADTNTYMNALVARMSQGEHLLESIHRRKDGTHYYVEISIQHRPTHGGQMIVFLRDITDRKQAEADLKKSANSLAEAQRIAHVGSWELDIDTHNLEWSEETYRIFGVDRDEFIPTMESFTECIHIDDRPIVDQATMASWSGQEAFNVFHRIILPNGDLRHVHEVAEVIFDDAARPVKMLGTVKDVSERRVIELELANSRAELKSIYDHTPVLMCVVDKDRRVVNANHAFTSFTGIADIESMQGRVYGLFSCIEAVNDPGQCGERSMCLKCSLHLSVEDTFNTGVTHQGVEHVVITERDGMRQEVVMLVSTSLMQMGDGKQVLLCLDDITDRKRAEKDKLRLETQLHHAMKMEAIGRLAGGVAHDFNNMLGVILGHTGMAIDSIDPELPLYEDLTEIRLAAERSADLTRQLLGFARKQTITPKLLTLNNSIESVLKMLERLIGENITLSWKPTEDLWDVKIDPSQFDQILANLCVNARDAMVDVGVVTIATSNQQINADFCANHAACVPGQYVRVTVSDNGCGMSAETMDRIFEPFFTTKIVGEGTGLGLSTIHGAVKQNEGFIDVTSVVGKGTSFDVYLPRYIGKEVAKTNAPMTLEMSGHETILLVEDELPVLKIAKLMLERSGYTVISASTPREAISLAEQNAGKIHLLLTDVLMPEMNGTVLAKSILSLDPSVKIVFMSGFTSDVIDKHCETDTVGFIQKPFTSKDITTTVRRTLDGILQ